MFIKHSSTVFEENRSHSFETFSNMQAGRGVSYYSCSSEDAFACTHERQNLPEAFPGNMVTLLYWSNSIPGNFTAATIFPDEGILKIPRPFPAPFFQVACSLRSLATCYSLPDQHLLQHKLWLVQFRMFQKTELEYWNGLNCCKKCFS